MSSVSIIGTRGYPSYYGGFETAVRHIAPYLAGHDWNVRVYSRGSEQGKNEDAVEVVKTAGFDSTRLSTLSYGFTSMWHCALHPTQAALIMNVANGFWLPLLRLRGVKTLVNVDGIEWERAKWGTAARTVFRMGAWMTARWADELVFDAREIGRIWHTRYGRNGTYIPYGGTAFPSAEIARPERPFVLMVARFVPENTVSEFLDAVPQISLFADVVLVGSTGYGGGLDDRAEALANDHDGVTWMGHVSDDHALHTLWSTCAAYFHGHSVGGTNPALVQAMACGAPVVARDTVYNREVLEEAGDFCQPEPDQIARAVEAVVTDSRHGEDLSRRARSRAAEAFTWEGVNGDYERALAALLGT